jgi:hypothetical protein
MLNIIIIMYLFIYGDKYLSYIHILIGKNMNIPMCRCNTYAPENENIVICEIYIVMYMYSYTNKYTHENAQI